MERPGPDSQFTEDVRQTLAMLADVVARRDVLSIAMLDPDVRREIERLMGSLVSLTDATVGRAPQPVEEPPWTSGDDTWKLWRADSHGMELMEYEARWTGALVTVRGAFIPGCETHPHRYTQRHVETYFGDTPAAAIEKFEAQQEEQMRYGRIVIYEARKALGEVTALRKRLGLPIPERRDAPQTKRSAADEIVM